MYHVWDFDQITEKICKFDALLEQYTVRVYMSVIENIYYGYHCKNLLAIQEGETIQLGENRLPVKFYW
ncbi:hypothetical protein [Bacillus wiedmannii]|uniref:hypothetical protein n=1 Tax=Bacillus wiedmannii TaxID=1890302 RepID=UPI001155AEA0|nr:hypothetical protein [Bacillus wiedmannii]